jgi:hypothetical protein
MKPLINENQHKKDYVFVMRLYSPLKSLFKKPLIEDMVSRGEVVSLISPKNPKECFISICDLYFIYDFLENQELNMDQKIN